MPTDTTMARFVRRLRASVLGDPAGADDGALLTAYVDRRDPDALAALVGRHGPMVWAACRRLTRRPEDAEDAFQATVLVLARRAEAVSPPGMVGAWLHGVACKTAARTRAAADRRAARERQASVPDPAVSDPEPGADLRAVLDAEVARLPDKYRAVVVLCDLEGRTRADVASLLGVPEGTVAGRLARARGLLAGRLTRRGVTLPAGGLAAGLSAGPAAGVPARLTEAAVAAAGVFAAGGPATEGVPAHVVSICEGTTRLMLITKLRVTAAALVSAGVGAGAVWLAPAWVSAGPLEPGGPPAVSAGAAVPVDSTPRAGPQGGVPPAAGDDRVRSLREEKLAVLAGAADVAEKGYKAGRVTYLEVLGVRRRVLEAELDLCRTDAERVAVLGRKVEAAREAEAVLSKLGRNGAATSGEAVAATVARLDAEIELEAAKAGVRAAPKSR